MVSVFLCDFWVALLIFILSFQFHSTLWRQKKIIIVCLHKLKSPTKICLLLAFVNICWKFVKFFFNIFYYIITMSPWLPAVMDVGPETREQNISQCTDGWRKNIQNVSQYTDGWQENIHNISQYTDGWRVNIYCIATLYMDGKRI